MADHICQCWHCQPDAYPEPPAEETIAYCAIQQPKQRPIPTWARTPKRPVALTRVFLDGVECDQNGPVIVFEAMSGNPGWVVGYENQQGKGVRSIHLCGTCLRNLGAGYPLAECTTVRHGKVVLEWSNLKGV